MGSLPLVIAMTSLVIVVPCLAAVGLRATGLVNSPVFLIIVPVVSSVLFSHGISAFWKRRRSGSPLLFEDLMLWGWLRRRRFEKLLSRSEEFVGPGAGGSTAPAQRARELERLAGALEARDPRTHGHSRRVARHATSIARGLKLPAEDVARIRTAALLHDIGKIHTPWEILEKPGALTDAEFAEIRKHPAVGAELVAGMGDPELTAIVRHHHERIDGGGYPDGLVRGQIPMGARIIAVADTFDALTSARSYRSPRSHDQALGILREESGSQLDDRSVRAFDDRYSSRRPVAFFAAVVGLGRQAGQSMISFGTGASQVAAVGAAAAVIGAAPAADIVRDQKQPEPPSIVRGADPSPATVTAEVVPGGPAPAGSRISANAAHNGTGGKPGERTGPTGNLSGTDSGPSTGDPGSGTGSGVAEGGGGQSTGGSGSSTGGDGAGAGDSGPGTGSTGNAVGTATDNVGKTVTAVTETVQKPVQQAIGQVTETIPPLPGNGPVSQGVNGTVGGVKDTLGKLTGKP